MTLNETTRAVSSGEHGVGRSDLLPSDNTMERAEPLGEVMPSDGPARRCHAREATLGHIRTKRITAFALGAGRIVATVLICAGAFLAVVVIWDFYISAPWTRDGRVRVQVASIAPQVSGQITRVNIVDNQYVHKGDVLYIIDPFDFKSALDQARAQLMTKAADLQVKQLQARRRQALTDLAATVEEKQLMAGAATQADGAFQAAQAQVQQAEVNLSRTEIRSPVNGYVTNLLMRVGDYAHAGITNAAIIDADSYWIDGYFEETKLSHICVGAAAEAQLLGYDEPVLGRVESVTRGISVSDASPSTQGLPNVDPIYTWVRLAQRVPVRLKITNVPPGVPLVSGLTATVTIKEGESTGENWFSNRMMGLRGHWYGRWPGSHPKTECLAVAGFVAPAASLTTPEPSRMLTTEEINPGLAPGLVTPPRAEAVH
jgi:RND family efflux transporter MFP subunit